jgi:hypothetical protein
VSPTSDRPRPRLAPGAFAVLADAGLRTPIGTDLVLHERKDPEAVVLDGERLAAVVIEAAERYRTALAVPLMDLRLEKADLVGRVRAGAHADAFHFDEPPTEADLERARDTAAAPFPARHRAHLDAIAAVAARRPGLVPMGMVIGPFSLATKLLPDPIGAVGLAGRGIAAADEPLVAAAERALELSETIRRKVEAMLTEGTA